MSPGRRELVTRVSAASATIFALLMISILPLFATAGPISYGHTWGTNDNERATAVVARISSGGALVFAENITEIFLPLRIATDPLTGGFVVVGRGPSYVNGIVGAFTSTGSLRWARASATSAAPVSVAVDGSGRSFVLLDRSNGNSAVDAFDSNGTLLGQIVIGSYYTTPVHPRGLIVASGGPLVLGPTVK